MAVDFSDFVSAKRWFEAQSVEIRCQMASRAALRVVANFRGYEGAEKSDLTMALLRAILTSAGRGLGRPADVDWDLAYSAAFSADSAAARSADTAALSADSAAFSSSAAALSADSSAAFSSAAAAARSADSSAAHSATAFDAENIDTLASLPVWEGAPVPEAIARNHDLFLADLAADSAFAFWHRFYNGMWHGTFTDWDLALEVIKIDETDWKKGHQHIAQVIAGIEARMSDAALNQEALKSHLGSIIQFPKLYRDFAEGTGIQIGAAVTTFKSEAPSNCLPRGFETYEQLPAAFDNIAKAMDIDDDKDVIIAALQKEVNVLHATISQLRLDLLEARQSLSDMKLDTIEAAQIRTFGEKAQTFLTNVTLVGAIGMGISSFFGVSEEQLRYEALKHELEALALEMQGVSASEALQNGSYAPAP